MFSKHCLRKRECFFLILRIEEAFLTIRFWRSSGGLLPMSHWPGLGSMPILNQSLAKRMGLNESIRIE